MQFQVPKGLFDILPYGCKEEWQLSDHWQHVEKIMRKIARDYGYKEIRTPIFESQDLFTVGVGQTSDIVSKEMYTFTDKANRKLALRPEGTSSVLRALAEKKLQMEAKVNKFFYIGPMFRYERPQSGRYRQHHQFGIEAIGIPSYEQDAEVIDMLFQLYSRLGLKNLHVELNTIGDAETRDNYRKALVEHLKPHLKELSADSKTRFEKNPLRILDSKDKKDHAALKGAPSILDFLSDDSKAHFNGLCKILETLDIPYTINPKIVRGLDYYSKTVFEITTESLGAQNSIGAGGRYDGFPALFGAGKLPGIGFGTGIERIIQAMIAQDVPFPTLTYPFVFFAPLGEKAKQVAFKLTAKLRHKGIPCEIDLAAKKIKDSLQRANNLGAIYSIVLGEKELEEKSLKLKHMETREEESVPFEGLIESIQKKWETR